MMCELVSRFLIRRDANLTMVFALALSAIVMLAGLAIDSRRIMGVKAALQVATDAAALEAAVALRAPGATSQQTKRDADAANYQVRGKAAFDANLGQGAWDGTPRIKLARNRDVVTATATGQARTLFMSMFGSELMEVSAMARATTESGPPICVMSTETGGGSTISFKDKTDFHADNCVVHTNGTGGPALHIAGQATATASDFCAVGGAAGAPHKFSPAPREGCTPIADPAYAIPAPPTGPCTTLTLVDAGENVVLAPGRYCNGLTIRGAARLAQGIYYFEQPLIIEGDATVTGDEVLLHFHSAAAHFDIKGRASVELVAPKSGPYNGFLMTQTAITSELDSFIQDFSNVDFVGALYMPRMDLNVRTEARLGVETDYIALIFDSVRFDDEVVVRMNAQPALTGHADRLPRAFYMPRLLN